MRLLVLNMSDTLNYGSMMMAENLFYYLAQEMTGETLEFIVATPNARETTSRFHEALGEARSQIQISAIHPADIIRGSRVSRRLSELTGVGIANRLGSTVKDIAGVVVLGGDDYTEDYGYMSALLSLLRLKGLAAAGKKVVMCSQTIGPFHSWRLPAAKKMLSFVTHIVARDPLTYEYLSRQCGLHNVSLGADLAFLHLARERDELNVSIPGLGPRYSTIVPSELIWRYGRQKERSAYLGLLVNLSLMILEAHEDGQLLILPHVVRRDVNDDRLAGRDLVILLRRRGISRSRLVFVDKPLLPYQARGLLRGSDFVATGRMHAAISAFVEGVPVLTFAYSRKCEGIIDRYLGLHDLVVDVRNHTWKEIEDVCRQRTSFIIEHRASLRDKISVVVSRMQELALLNVKEVAKTLA